MLISLDYSVTFPTTGREFIGAFDFEKGYTAITGPNESGKSLLFEFTRFLLFGTAALRGDAEDYKTLKAKGEVVIRGENYVIDRTMRKAVIKRDGKELATGVSAVNQKVVQLLGYGIAVFDIANSINQGEVERLGSMTPTQRRQLVDSVIGLDVLDEIAKWATGEVKIMNAAIDATRRVTVKPTEPVKPENYRPSEAVKADLDFAGAEHKELSELTGWLKNEIPEPKRPACNIALPAENVKVFADQRIALRREIADMRAKMVSLVSTARFTLEQLDQQEQLQNGWAEWALNTHWLARVSPPKFTQQQLDGWLADHGLLHKYGQLDALCRQLDVAIQGAVTCVECDHVNHTDPALVQQLRTKITDLGPLSPRPSAPPRTPLQIAEHQRELEEWDKIKDEYAERSSRIAPQKPEILTGRDIQRLRSEAQQVVERAALAPAVSQLEKKLMAMPDYEAMYNERVSYEAQLESFFKATTHYQNWFMERQKKTFRATQLAGAEDRVFKLHCEHTDSLSYERSLETYETLLARFTENTAVIDGYTADAEEFGKIKTAMGLLRTKVKSHLIPSLNRVSSHLIGLMTGGQRNYIVIDEDFNVTVDGQSLATLSGSGKSVANLSIRIALGQVLTNKVFSVLLADEIDAAMDNFRAENTSNVLQTLTNSISQIMLVSHKEVEATNRIQLGDIDDSPDEERSGDIS